MNHRHFILYKPDGYLSQFLNHQTKRKNKKLLGELYDFPDGTMAIGRLDEPSEGLLFLTSDGKISEHIRSKNIEKEYFIQIDGVIDNQLITKLSSGVEITTDTGPYMTKPCKTSLLESAPALPPRNRKIRDERHGPTSWVSITLTEGKYRQVRKMTAAVGYPTLRLVRVRIGNISINDMTPGQVIEVAQFDV